MSGFGPATAQVCSELERSCTRANEEIAALSHLSRPIAQVPRPDAAAAIGPRPRSRPFASRREPAVLGLGREWPGRCAAVAVCPAGGLITGFAGPGAGCGPSHGRRACQPPWAYKNAQASIIMRNERALFLCRRVKSVRHGDLGWLTGTIWCYVQRAPPGAGPLSSHG